MNILTDKEQKQLGKYSELEIATMFLQGHLTEMDEFEYMDEEHAIYGKTVISLRDNKFEEYSYLSKTTYPKENDAGHRGYHLFSTLQLNMYLDKEPKYTHIKKEFEY